MAAGILQYITFFFLLPLVCIAQNSHDTVEYYAEVVVYYTSQYSYPSYSADQITGPPDAYPNYGFSAKAWLQSTLSSHQSVTVEFEQYLQITDIDIYEIYHAGAVIKVDLLDGDDYVSVYTAGAQVIQSSKILTVPVPSNKQITTNRLRITVDPTVSRSYVGIDAVRVTGLKADNYESQYVSNVVSYTSQLNNNVYAAKQVFGEPNVYPLYGGYYYVWIPGDLTRPQSITVAFDDKTYIETIEIFEVYLPGAVTSIELLNTGSGSYTTVYNADPVYIISKSRILTVKVPVAKQLFTDTLRVTVDPRVTRSYLRIDAIKVTGKKHISG